MGKRTEPNCDALLSLDLWGRVLAFAAPRSADDKRLGSLSPPPRFRDQAAFYQLRLRCKTFNQAFLDYPHLCRALVLTHPPRSRNSLLRWLQRHHGSVRSFAGYVGSPTVELVLKALLQTPSALRTLFLYQCDPKGLTSLQGWGNLKNLTTLDIVDPLDQLDLSMLNILRLETMELHAGSYRCIHLPEHLSSLTLGWSYPSLSARGGLFDVYQEAEDFIWQSIDRHTSRLGSRLPCIGRPDLFGKPNGGWWG